MEQFFGNASAIAGSAIGNPLILAALVVPPLAIATFICLRKANEIIRLAVPTLAGFAVLALLLLLLFKTPDCSEPDNCHPDKSPVAVASQLAMVSTRTSADNFATHCVTTRKTCELLDPGSLSAGMPCYCKTKAGFFPGVAR
jgi:hypothetical protein